MMSRFPFLSLNFSCLLFADLKLAELGSTNENSAPPDGAKCNYKSQVKLLNHVCKTLVKPFNIRKIRIIDLSLFSKVRMFAFKHRFPKFLSCSYILLFRLISAVQENNKNWKLSEDYMASD
jgi:hypothetical protein